MISFRRLPLLVGAVLITASAAFAQSGTINITGTTPEAFSLTNTSGGALSPGVIAFGPLTPANSTTVVSDSVTVRMRSNKAYKLSIQTTAFNISAPGTDDDGDPIAATDIGIGITALTLNAPNVANGASRAETVATGFSVPSGNWPAGTNGLTPGCGQTLASTQSTSTEILRGQRISKKGNLATDNNFIEVNIGVATLPQFFTPNGGFTATVTLTMASQ